MRALRSEACALKGFRGTADAARGAPFARSRSIFLEHGADVNVCGPNQCRPLHCAVHYRSRRVLPLLLATPGVDVNAPNNKGWRPLDVCATAVEARALLDAGARCAAAAKSSLSSLHHAAYNVRPDVVTELLARGADVHQAVSLEAAANSFGVEFGGTALHFAAASLGRVHAQLNFGAARYFECVPEMADAGVASARRVAVVEALLAAGADVNSLSTPHATSSDELLMCKITPLMVAAQTGDSAIIKALLRAGAPANAVEQTMGWMALHYAAAMGRTDAVYALVASGADLDQGVQGQLTRTPLLWAVLGCKHGAVRALLESGADTTVVTELLAVPPVELLPTVVDATTRELVAKHVAGLSRPARACALPACEARRRVDYDDKKLLACPCKARVLQAVLPRLAASNILCSDTHAVLCHACVQLAYYCCKEHQVADRKRHKAARKAALAQQAGGGGAI